MELVIREVIEEKGDFAHVVVSREVFDAVKGFDVPNWKGEAHPKAVEGKVYATSRNKAGQGVRIFQFNDGKELFLRYNTEERKTTFVVSSDVAKTSLRSLEQERAGEPVLGFSF